MSPRPAAYTQHIKTTRKRSANSLNNAEEDPDAAAAGAHDNIHLDPQDPAATSKTKVARVDYTILNNHDPKPTSYSNSNSNSNTDSISLAPAMIPLDNSWMVHSMRTSENGSATSSPTSLSGTSRQNHVVSSIRNTAAHLSQSPEMVCIFLNPSFFAFFAFFRFFSFFFI